MQQPENEQAQQRDRYITFDGLDCDHNAETLVAAVRRHIAETDEARQWADYFSNKFIEKERLGVDDLFFVGSQLNNLYSYFEELEDEPMQELLYQVEQECC